MPLAIVTLADRPDLLPTVAAWIFEQWWSHDARYDAETLGKNLAAKRSTDRIYESFVALVDSVPVGTATILDHDVGTERWPYLTPWVAAVYVIPKARRQGIGARLVSHATGFAQSRGFKIVHLWTTDRSEWYEGLGWQVIERFGNNGTLVSVLKYVKPA